MRKLRIFIVELILVALLVGWYIDKFPETLDPFIPWILWAILAHLTWETVLQTERIRARVGRAAARKKYMMWIIAFALGGTISIFYLRIAQAGVSKLTEFGNSHRDSFKQQGSPAMPSSSEPEPSKTEAPTVQPIPNANKPDGTQVVRGGPPDSVPQPPARPRVLPESQMAVITELEQFLIGRDESSLRQAFGFPLMMEKNIRLNILGVSHYRAGTPFTNEMKRENSIGTELMLDTNGKKQLLKLDHVNHARNKGIR